MAAQGRYTWEIIVTGKPSGEPSWAGPIVARALKPKGAKGGKKKGARRVA